MSAEDFIYLTPHLVLGLGGLLVLLLGVLPKPWDQRLPYGATIILFVLAASGILYSWQDQTTVLNLLVIDSTSSLFSLVFVLAGLACVLLARHYQPLAGEVREAFYGLILFSTLGMLMLVSAANLLVAFLGLELVVIPLFGLLAWQSKRLGAIESGIKYAVLASLAAAFFLYGVVLIYAGSGTLMPGQLVQLLNQGQADMYLVQIGFALILIGVGFELALVPFHMWLPDIYQGAPTPIAAFMGTVVKVATLVFLIRLVHWQLPESIWLHFKWIFWALAAVTVLVGNILALRQQNLKRLLAYSSVAHMGYIFIAIASGTAFSFKAALYYTLAYAVTGFAVFAVLSVLGKAQGSCELGAYRGLGRRYPWLGIVLAIGLLSMAGLPPLSGFFAKLFVFYAAVQSGLIGLLVLAIIMAAVSFYYYLKVLVVFFSVDQQQGTAQPIALGPSLVLLISAVLTVALGVYAQLFLSYPL
jgi:NADH-quinone oxidoreductase subunit N